MANIPTNQSKTSSMFVGQATTTGVKVGGRTVSNSPNDYQGAVIVCNYGKGIAAVVNAPNVEADGEEEETGNS